MAKKATAAKPAEKEETGGALIVIETVKAQEVFVPDGTKKLIEIVEAAVAKFVPDVTTEEGRKAIGKMDRTIAASKNGIEKLKLEYTKDLRDRVGIVNAEGKAFFERMEELQAQVSAPLDKWKADEAERVKAHNDRLAELKSLSIWGPEITVEDLKARQDKAAELHDESYDWEDFDELASAEYDSVAGMIEAEIPRAQKRADDAKELEDLRAKQAIRDKADEDDRLRKEGEDKAKKDAQDKIDEAARKTAQAETDRKTRLSNGLDTLSSLGRVSETATSSQIRSRIEEINRNHANFGDWQEKADDAEKIRASIVQELTTMADQKAVSEKAAEDKRIADAAQKVKDEEDAAEHLREQNKEHRKKIGNAAIAALVEHAKISQEDARAALVAIHEGKIPNVKISY